MTDAEVKLELINKLIRELNEELFKSNQQIENTDFSGKLTSLEVVDISEASDTFYDSGCSWNDSGC